MLEQLIEFFIEYGYIAVFLVLLLCGFGLPIPEDITLVASGVISALTCNSDANFLCALKECNEAHFMFFISMLGVLVGDSIMFLLGYFFGHRVLKIKLISKVLTTERFKYVQEKFRKYGVWLIFFARFMPGLRAPTFVVAGITKRVSYLRFLLTDGFAAIISVPIWVYLGFWGTHKSKDLSQYIQKGQFGILIIIAIVILFFLFKFFWNRIKNVPKL
jgi:membrane protein DedA with SNARE-associated domain